MASIEQPNHENANHTHDHNENENGNTGTNGNYSNGTGAHANQANGVATKKLKTGKKTKQLVFSPKIELLFTVLLFVESVGILYYFASHDDYQAIFELFMCILITASGVYLTKDLFKLFAKKFGSPKNISKPVNVRKFADQGWQLFIHLVFTAMEILILKDVTWWQKPETCWTASGLDYPLPPLMKRLYVLQLGARFWSSFSHRFLEVHHKDYFIMFIHHLVTIALTGGTYMVTMYGIGVLILLVHNASDIIVDVLKMSNHLGWESKKYFFLTEILFVTNLITWAVSRLWIFPVYLVYTSVYENVERCAALGITLECSVMRVMLMTLVLMHTWWFYLFLKMGYRLVTTGNAHAAAREEYEGESDDERNGHSSKND